MNVGYSSERPVQILLQLMKHHGVRKVIASPGTTNIGFVMSIQQDPWFEVYSCVDERSAAYLACGLAAESGEAVALSCTGATASRNYYPGLTEAFYRKLPILAITAALHEGRIGQNIPQILDRRVVANDAAVKSIQIPAVYSEEDEWMVNLRINEALLELKHRGGGPVHLNLTTTCSMAFGVKDLPPTRFIDRVMLDDTFPDIGKGRNAIFVGAHLKWSDKLLRDVECFCRLNNAVVITDHTGNYSGENGVLANLISDQQGANSERLSFDTLIHIGDVSGAYLKLKAKSVWRVNPDGEIRDPYKALRYIFEMSEEAFFEKCNKISPMGEIAHAGSVNKVSPQAAELQRVYSKIENQITDIPFSNVWIAQQTAHILPENSVLYLGILNSLRAWNFFEVPNSTLCFANTGGFGIDGGLSSLIGASLAEPEKIHFGIMGDLGFFYDMNVLGNRHIGANIRIMLVNNGCGTEFKNYSHPAAAFDSEADPYIAAADHFGSKSNTLVKHYAEDLGFCYLSASSKDEYLASYDLFVAAEKLEKPILFEVFTKSKDESDALEKVLSVEKDPMVSAKKTIKKIIGPSAINAVKKVMRK